VAGPRRDLAITQRAKLSSKRVTRDRQLELVPDSLRQIAFTGLIAAGTRCNSISCSTGMSKGDLDILQSQLELIGIELLRPATETMPHEGVDNLLKALDLGVRFALGNDQFCQPGLRCGPLLRQHPGLLQDERTHPVRTAANGGSLPDLASYLPRKASTPS
jgi:hypothetical protein